MNSFRNLFPLGLVALLAVGGCSILENNGQAELPPAWQTDVVDPNYVDDANMLTLGGWDISVEASDLRLGWAREVADDGTPFIFPLEDSVLVQIYGSTTCPAEINLPYSGLGDLLTLQIVVNLYAAMERDPQLMACSADIKPFTYRVFTETENSLTPEDWVYIAENADWSDLREFGEDGNPSQVVSKPFRHADYVMNTQDEIVKMREQPSPLGDEVQQVHPVLSYLDDDGNIVEELVVID